MSSEDTQQRIAEILWEHRWYLNRDNPPFGRCACDWPPTEARLEINAREHPAHVAQVVMAALNDYYDAVPEGFHVQETLDGERLVPNDPSEKEPL